MNLECRILTIGKSPYTGHVYTEEAVRKAIDKVTFPIFGCNGVPDFDDNYRIKMSEVSCKADSFKIEDGFVVAAIEVLDTDRGLELQKLLNTPDNKIDFRTSNIGKGEDVGGDIVISDFSFRGIFAIADDEEGDKVE